MIYEAIFTFAEPLQLTSETQLRVTLLQQAGDNKTMRRFRLAALVESLRQTIATSGMVFVIVVTGILFTRFMVHTNVTADFVALIALLRFHRLAPLAFKGGTAQQAAAALAAGLVGAPDAATVKTAQQAIGQSPPAAPAEPPLAGAQLPALVIDKPLRSGQQVYARGRDLVVMAMVNAGAEVIADGHIHVYAPLRGKAIAGARGNADARIFALSLEPELISIAGIYRTTENALPPEVWGRATQVRLVAGPEGERLVMEPLSS